MKKINLILFLITILSINDSITVNNFQDILSELTNFTKKATTAPSNTKQKPTTIKKGLNFDLEHAQKLAQKTSIKAMEAASLSVAAIKNLTLHLDNIQKINTVAAHLNNIVSGKRNSIEEVEKAKQVLHEVLSEARKLEKNAHEVTVHLEKTLRITTKLNQRLHITGNIIAPKLSHILDTLKTQTSPL